MDRAHRTAAASLRPAAIERAAPAAGIERTRKGQPKALASLVGGILRHPARLHGRLERSLELRFRAQRPAGGHRL